mgnify:CR=1 FL=1
MRNAKQDSYNYEGKTEIEGYQERFKENLQNEAELVKYYTEALSNPTMIQYVDKESGQLVTTTSSKLFLQEGGLYAGGGVPLTPVTLEIDPSS